MNLIEIHNFSVDPEPDPYMNGYLSRGEVQAALGVPVNYTEVIESVNQVFVRTGDMNRGGAIEDMASLLDNGVKVAMMYGDRDAVSFPGNENHPNLHEQNR